MKIGYARVSTKEQNLNLQLDALLSNGCEKIYKDVVSGTKAERPELNKMLEHLRKGDVIIIWKLDRLGRSLKHLVELVAYLNENNVGLQSINDPVDTTTPQGRLIFNIFASLAEFERDVISERTKAGLEAARAKGKKGGRPKGLSKEAEKTAIAAKVLHQQKELSITEICQKLSISKATLYRYLKHQSEL